MTTREERIRALRADLAAIGERMGRISRHAGQPNRPMHLEIQRSDSLLRQAEGIRKELEQLGPLPEDDEFEEFDEEDEWS